MYMFVLLLNPPCNLISCPHPACMCTPLHAHDLPPCPFNLSPRLFLPLTPASSFILSLLSTPTYTSRHVTSRLLNLLTSYQPYLTLPCLTSPYLTLPYNFFFSPPSPRTSPLLFLDESVRDRADDNGYIS